MQLSLPRQKRILIMFGLGIFLSGILNLFYAFNWLGVNDIVYIRTEDDFYVVGEMLDSVGELTAWIIAIWCIKKATSGLPYAPYVITLYLDFKITELAYVIFFNPFVVNASQLYCIGISSLFFITQIYLDKKFEWFRKLKVFKA